MDGVLARAKRVVRCIADAGECWVMQRHMQSDVVLVGLLIE